MWDRVAEMNALRPKLGEEPWLYTGDMNLEHGGRAISVNRMFNYANVVELTDLGSATGADGGYLLETGSVSVIDRPNMMSRRKIRDAMRSSGLTMADLRRDYQGDDKWKRMALIAGACYQYGFRDIETERVLVTDREAFDEACERSGNDGWQNMSEDCESLTDAFEEELA